MSSRRLNATLGAGCSALLVCLMLSACGNDEGDGKTVANTPTGDQTTLPDTSSVTLAANESRRSKTNDVLDWLKMSPEKSAADKNADKKPPEPAKPADAKPTAAAPPVIAPVVAPPVQPALVERPVLQQVSAPARDNFANTAPKEVSAPPVVAAAAPVAPAAPTPAAGLKIVSREQPSFPKEAIRAGTLSGHVIAKIEVGADGNVKNVEVVESHPSHVFDHAVIAAAKNWKYQPMSEAASTMAEFDFKADQ